MTIPDNVREFLLSKHRFPVLATVNPDGTIQQSVMWFDLEGDQVPVPVDDESLRKIANISGGEFFTAASLDELNRVYEKLQKDIGYETRRGDNSRPWLIAGTLLAIISAFAALAINRRLP